VRSFSLHFTLPHATDWCLLDDHSDSGSAVFFGTLLIMYLSGCAFFALFQLRIMKFYQMHYNRKTDENSILFNAALMLRLPAPLGFNFCQLTNIKVCVRVLAIQ